MGHLIQTPPVDVSQFVQLACIIPDPSANLTSAISHTMIHQCQRSHAARDCTQGYKAFSCAAHANRKIFRYDLDMRIGTFY